MRQRDLFTSMCRALLAPENAIRIAIRPDPELWEDVEIVDLVEDDGVVSWDQRTLGGVDLGLARSE